MPLKEQEATPPTHDGSPGVHAALLVLELLAKGRALSLADLARELGVAKSTLHRVCAVLVARGFAARAPGGRFSLGIRALGIGATSGQLPIVAAFRRVAADLLTRHDETVCLAVLDGEDSVFLAIEETSQPVRLVTHVGSRTTAFASASGRVHLAARPAAAISAQYGGRTLVTPVGRRLNGASELLAILAEVRQRGYAENDEETALGLWAASVPVRNADDTIVAALTFCVPGSRAPAARRARLVADLLEAGRRLSVDSAWLPAYDARHAMP